MNKDNILKSIEETLTLIEQARQVIEDRSDNEELLKDGNEKPIVKSSDEAELKKLRNKEKSTPSEIEKEKKSTLQESFGGVLLLSKLVMK